MLIVLILASTAPANSPPYRSIRGCRRLQNADSCATEVGTGYRSSLRALSCLLLVILPLCDQVGGLIMWWLKVVHNWR